MNPVKEALARGNVSVGTWMQFGHPGIGEILANAEYDWIAVDMEHSDIGIAEFTQVCRGIRGRGPITLARVRENDTLAIRQVLDMGAHGVIVPLVNSAAGARKAAAAAKYPPAGVRGFALHRNNEYGAAFDEYVRHANDDVLVIVMIESQEAVKNIEDIVAVDGVDGIFIGPYDLSGSFGGPGKLDDQGMKSALDRCLEACESAGKVAGLHVVSGTADDIRTAVDSGFKFIAVGMDTVFLDVGARTALEAAQAVSAGRVDGQA